MPIKVGIVGNYGTGKSSSILPIGNHKGLPPENTLIINSLGKDLPIKGFNKMYNMGRQNIKSNLDVNNLTKFIYDVYSKKENIKYVVIDDFIYLTTKHLIDKAKEHSFTKYNETAGNVGALMNALNSFSDDVFVFVMFHQELDEYGLRVRSASKMIDKLMNLEGLFTYILFTDTSVGDDGKVSYEFITNTTTNSQGILVPAKSPLGCFEDIRIPNDLGLVVDKINEYRS